MLKDRNIPDGGEYDLPDWSLFYWRAFLDLISDRNYVSETRLMSTSPGLPPMMMISNSPLPISWCARNEYAMREGLENEDYALFMRLTKALDIEYLKISDEKAKHQMTETEENNG